MVATTSFHPPKIRLHCRLMNEVHFQLTCVSQKRLCLSSLIYLQNVPDDFLELLSIGLVSLRNLLAQLVPVDLAEHILSPVPL